MKTILCSKALLYGAERAERGKFMKKTTKLMALFLAVVMCLGAVGCEGKKEPESKEGKALQLWITTLGEEAEVIQRVTEEIWNKEHPDTPVKITVVPGNSDDYYQKLSAAFATNNGPDMFCISNASSLKYVDAEIAYDVSKWLEPNKDDYMESVLNAVTFDEKMVAFPGNMDLMGIYCNNAMFEEAGIDLPKTWDELVDAANSLATDDRYGIIVQTDAQSGYQLFEFYPFLWMSGGEVLSEDGAAAINSEGTKQALSFYSRLLKAPGTCKKVENSNTDITPFGTGRTAMQICGSWAVVALAERYPEIDYSIIPYPTAKAGEKGSGVIGGWQYMVSSRGSNPSAAAEYLNWLWNSEVDIPMEAATKEGKFSPRQSVMEAAKEHYSQYPYSVFAEEILPISRIEPSYPAEVVTAAGTALQDAAYSNKSLDEILAAVQKKCQQAIE